MISLICCYNKIDEYESMLNSLRKQNIEYEIIGLNNTNGQFKSAAKALNTGAQRANGDILVFLHQDIEFMNSNSLSNFTKILKNNDDVIVGLFGSKYNKKEFNSKFNIVQTLDECIIAINKRIFERLKFNEELCDNWHLYVVELCLRAKKNNIKILEIKDSSQILHKSIGKKKKKYMKDYLKIMKTYKDENYIATTCKSMPNNILYYYCYFFIWKIKKCIFGNYPLMVKLKKIRGNKN